MKRVDKRTIEASYVRCLYEEYQKEYPTIHQVLSRYLSKLGYTTEQIEKIVEEEVFSSAVDAMRFGDYLATTEDIMKKYASIEYKTLHDINTFYEGVLAERYGVNTVNIDVYDAIRPALEKLIKMNKVKKIENPTHTGWFMYKYIG